MREAKNQLLELLSEPSDLDENVRRELLNTLLASSRPRRMTFEEFLDWADEDTLAEWVNGEVILSTPASRQHQELSGFLYKVLSAYVDVHKLGAVLQAPFLMKLAHSAREPDLLYIAKDNLKRISSAYLDGPADLVIEIISPESIGRDRGEKFYEYEQAAIPEYWLIDPKIERGEFYRLDQAGKYQLVNPDSQGIYRSNKVQDFWLRVDWLWQDPPPPVDDVLLEVGGESYAEHLIKRLRERGFL